MNLSQVWADHKAQGLSNFRVLSIIFKNRRMKKIFFFLVLTAIFIVPALGQTQIPVGENFYEDGTGIIYSKETSVDLKILQTNGWALGMNFGTLRTFYKTRFYNVEFGEIKNPREYRQSFDYFQGNTFSDVSRPFIFGKQNKFFVLRAGIGEKLLLSEKARRKGLAVGVSYEAGPSLGILKPYYLEFLVRVPDSGRVIKLSEKYTVENESRFLDITSIYGGAGFSKGLSEISVVPGGHLKGALHFDWGAFDAVVKALEAGFVVDFYFKTVPIMVDSPNLENVKNSPVFVNVYINLQLGKRR